MSIDIPNSWTFKNPHVAHGFDSHVREQLPWYDFATQAIAHIGRHYIPTSGIVYDIGASTGNIGLALKQTLEERCGKLIAIEESEDMASLYKGGGELVIANAIDYEFKNFDFAVCFLVLMFFPVNIRRAWIASLISKMNPGGAIVIVDKVITPHGYIGTVLRRLSMAWKVDTGTSASDIVRKELSLAGYQRPINPSILEEVGIRFFQIGEFSGWVIEKSE
mgnify:CR=1 FL=1